MASNPLTHLVLRGGASQSLSTFHPQLVSALAPGPSLSGTGTEQSQLTGGSTLSFLSTL